MRKGFTIVELLIYMGLLSILLVVLADISGSIFSLQSESKAVSTVAQDGRFILQRLSYDVRRASSITSPTLGTTDTSSQLVVNGVPTTYGVASGNLIITDSSGSDVLTSVGSQISNLSFQRIGNAGGKNSLQIKFRLTSRQNLPQGPETRDFETTIGLR